MTSAADATTAFNVPLIIRGKVIEDETVEIGGRRGGVSFRTPDVNRHYEQIVLRDPGAIRDLYSLGTDEILDYLEALGSSLSPETNPHMRRALDASIAVSGQSPAILRFMYENQAQVLKKARVREIVDAAFGGPYLDQWVSHSRSDRAIRVRAFGSRMVHINPGNGVAIALQSIMNTALLRGDAIIKSPSNDPLTAAAIARTMIDMAPDHPITRHITVAYWKGGDAAFEKRLYRPANIEKIVAWGGAASMKHIRAYLGPGIDLIALDPKSSCSLIGAAAFDSEPSMRRVAALLARDVGYFNQEGCVSSRMGFVESGTDATGIETLNRFGQIVYEALQELPATLSCNAHPGFSAVLRDEVEGIRSNPYFRVIGCKADEGGIVVSQEPEPVDFAEHLSGRVVNLVPLARIEDAYPHITIDTQTIGIYPEALKDKVRDECAWRGTQRMTSLGWSTAIGFAQPHDAIEPLRRMARWLVIEDFEEKDLERSGIFSGA